MDKKPFFQSLKTWIVRLFFGGLILFLLVLFMLSSITYSEGFVIGTPTTFSKKGVLFKSYEGEIDVSHNESANFGNMQSDKWTFSVKKNVKKEVLNSIETAIEKDKRAKLFYKEKYWKSFWAGDTKYYVYEVEILE